MVGNIAPFESGGGASGLLNAIVVPTTFSIREVDGITSERPNIESDVQKDLGLSTMTSLHSYDAACAIPGELNILAKLQGRFHGAGLNMIFRPSYGNTRRNNVLEYNVTEEVTQFLKDIGDVPNRGLGRQQDVILKAVPYTQAIQDLLNPETGKPDLKKGVDIHFETGLFLRAPPTDIRPKVPRGTISRLASIPHGTSIVCQGFEPDMKKPISGKPNIKPVSVLPFPMGTPSDQETFADFFPQLNFNRKFNLRIPQEIKSGDVLTPSLMLNPNQMLNELNDNSTKKRVKEHFFFTVHSDTRVSGIPGGGTANIAFLHGSAIHDGRQNPGPNAHSVTVGCDYWVSTVEYDVLLPEGDFSGEKKVNQVVDSEARKEEKAAEKLLISPRFDIELNTKIPPNTIVKLEATQIQYSQNVTLDFDEMGWPHVSVATLSPLDPVPVQASRLVF